MWFSTTQNNNSFTTVAHINNEEVCKCTVSRDSNTWTISSWYTIKKYQHHGYGKLTLQECIKALAKKFIMPECVKYIWNGANQYVYDWLQENFDAVCECPIAVQKYSVEDDWSSHVYTLNKDKFFAYLLKDDTTKLIEIYDGLQV